MSKPLAYLVVEYLPHVMHGSKPRPARIDGHYDNKAIAEEVAQLWAEAPLHAESRVVVVEIVAEAKAPAHWLERTA
jgi:hypothetical protein